MTLLIEWHDMARFGTLFRTRRRGMTFTEVMFAVILLGIGIIMIAATLPFAIQQTKTTADETVGAGIAENSLASMQGSISSSLLPPPPGTLVGTPSRVYWLNPNDPDPTLTAQQRATFTAAWDAIRGNLVLDSDPRFAWIPFYRRDLDPTSGVAPVPLRGMPFAQLYMIGVQVAGTSNFAKDAYFPALDIANATSTNSTFQPRLVSVVLFQGAGGSPDRIQFARASAARVTPAAVDDPNAPNGYEPVGTGAFVIIANDPGSTTPSAAGPPGAANGRIYRCGNPVPGTVDTWELQPGYDVASGVNPGASGTAGVSVACTAYVVGKRLTNPMAVYNTPNNTYIDGVQDLVAVSTFIRLN